ncbi:MAG: diguanylate cyclase [Candidatus Gastranaerophilales bacterium]|nr:diguanylate cyclase [Candidatus Gastranaerophilales bacterium]
MAKKVLIIDDSYTQLSSLKIFFKREGFDVDTAKNGVEGFVKVYKNTPDVIISDVLMPHLGGFQLCRLLKNNKETHDIPFIMLTVLDKNLDKFWGSQSGADIFLRKDYDMATIVKAAIDISEKMPVPDSVKKELATYEIEEDEIISQINKILDDELMKTTITNKFREISDYTKDEKATAVDIFNVISAIADYDLACIYFVSPDNTAAKRLIFHEQNVSVDNETMLSVWRQLLPDAAGDFKPEKILSENEKEQLSSFDDLLSKKEMDFYYEDTLIGKLCFYSKENLRWNKMRFMNIIKSELDLFLRLKYLYTKTCFLSITDELTQLYARRHLKSVLSQEFERARRYGSFITVAMIDIDDFKMVNDKYGHLAGDYVLKEVSKIFINTLRKTDFVYRYGGEEICILMPETTVQKAFIPLERLRKTVENRNFVFEDKKMHVTVSIGAAQYTKNARNAAELLEKADAALYTAKKSGKNMVIITDGE